MSFPTSKFEGMPKKDCTCHGCSKMKKIHTDDSVDFLVKDIVDKVNVIAESDQFKSMKEKSIEDDSGFRVPSLSDSHLIRLPHCMKKYYFNIVEKVCLESDGELYSMTDFVRIDDETTENSQKEWTNFIRRLKSECMRHPNVIEKIDNMIYNLCETQDSFHQQLLQIAFVAQNNHQVDKITWKIEISGEHHIQCPVSEKFVKETIDHITENKIRLYINDPY